MSTTIVAYLNKLLLIAGIGGLFAILPRISAYRTLFGTVVGENVAGSTAARLAHHQYNRTVGIFTALALTVSLCGILFVELCLIKTSRAPPCRLVLLA